MSKVSRDTRPEKDGSGKLRAREAVVRDLPAPGEKKVYILSSAQNNTLLHRQCWRNILALAAYENAELLVSPYTYDKGSIGAAGAKRGTQKSTDKEEAWWDSEVEPYLNQERIEIAPGLIWCGELNLLPTAVNPISGFESYTGRASAILPHAKFQVQCVASPKHRGTKFVYTTGTVTLRNYIQKKAGQKAEFHHGYGALIVEVDSDGDWFVRILNADSEGVIYDLDRKVDCGTVTTGHRPKGVAWGDIHVDQLEPRMETLAWGSVAYGVADRPKYTFAPGNIVDALDPDEQVFHDVLDFRSGNHHDRDDPWKTFKKFVNGRLNVEEEIARAAAFIGRAHRNGRRSVIVCSNHDMALIRWLKEVDFREDPENAVFSLRANLAAYDAMSAGQNDFYAVEWAFEQAWLRENDERMLAALSLGEVRFLRRDEEHVLCKEAGGGIEVGMHGDKGANGAKGNLRSFARTGRKCIVGDSHTPGLFEGAMQVGVMGSLDQGYNEGMSSWSHTNAIVYPNGKRTLFTIWNGKWRA